VSLRGTGSPIYPQRAVVIVGMFAPEGAHGVGRHDVDRFRRALGLGAVAALVLAGAFGVWARYTLRASLPLLDGERPMAGLSAPVRVDRDHLGIPTVRGATRADVARATGFLHAQDRFFQMDTLRRRPAGELAALVGPAALPADREIRVHRLRAVAHEALGLLTPADRAVLDAYVAGVNAGLAALGASPFEYYLLRQTPEPWLAEDSLLVVLAMFVTLQDSTGAYESTRGTMRDVLPREALEFFAPRGTSWDTPILGAAFELPPMPDARVFNLRARRTGRPTGIHLPSQVVRAPEVESAAARAGGVGSNSFAVAGTLTPDGGALVANDMHLVIRVPNIWYRASLEWRAADGEAHHVTGVTLPGMPSVVVGSNTFIAWGFTNSYGDFGDLVELHLDPANPRRYRTPEGYRAFEQHEELLRVAGEPDEHLTADWTIWGPVLGRDHRGRLRAYRWVAHDARMLAGSVTPLEMARTVEDAITDANGAGTPAQNLLAADRSGSIGWSIYGSLPRRFGMDGALPGTWADGTRGWSGYLADDDYPRVINPPTDRLWTANARVVGGEMLARIGDGSYEVGSRARIIRDRLMARERFTPTDLLAVQLDARATFLERWRGLLLKTLTPAAIKDHPARARFRAVVEKDWSGQASPESAGYRLVRAFRDRVSQWVFAFVLADCYEADEHFDYTTERKREGPLWELVTRQPYHLLDPAFASWDALLLTALDRIVEDLEREHGDDLADRAWKEANVTAYRHPLSTAIPLLGWWLDMPTTALPGDLYTPRMAFGPTGASERMVVSPGHEADGILQMPTGQSGHPLSPHYADSHAAWVRGEPTPFLPGPAIHTLRLVP